MSKVVFNPSFGVGMMFTAKIPTRVMEYLSKHQVEMGGMELTPAFREVPFLRVGDVREAGVDVPLHWKDTNLVAPMIHNIAFYLTPVFSSGMALSVAMKGVNLRTGQQEQGVLTDTPCQSYWSRQPAWIDGYVPGSRMGVRQFVPLRGEAEMASDIASIVGVRPDNPWIDAIVHSFFLPTDLSKLTTRYNRDDLFLESAVSYSKTVLERGERDLGEVEEVGMGAGALMKQQHQDDPTVSVRDYQKDPLSRLVIRLAWHDWWNQAANAVREEPITPRIVHDLMEKQKAYERTIYRQLHLPVDTDVDQFPMPK